MLSFIVFIGCDSEVEKAEALLLIPMPDKIRQGQGALDIRAGFKLYTEGDVSDVLLDYIASVEDIKQQSDGVMLKVQIDEDKTTYDDDEAYVIAVTARGVEIKANAEAGLFYGLQTLIQIIHDTDGLLPAVTIEDAPRFAYRGMMLDCSRHFLSLDFLKKQIDMMAYLKLNRFHWHLTDGPGWRLQIHQYPELTEIAAWRPQVTWKEWWNSGRQYVEKGTPGAYGGYYTQDEARELVQYAADRHITVIPEIELPGHSEEVLAVYPHLSCSGRPYVSSEFCIGNLETYSFLENVLSEVIDVFPSEYIHIGGDEASYEHWKICAKCQALKRKEGYEEEAQLQSHLIKHIEQFLNSKGRSIIGWDDISDGGLAPNATVMSWRGEDGGIAAAKSGHDVIMTPASHCYFDSYQGMPDKQPEAIGGFLPIEKVYAYNPISEMLSSDETNHILGLQANLWAEYIVSEDHMEYMIYPRILAMAEVAWTQLDNKSWDDFKVRVNRFIPYLQNRGYNTYTLSAEPFLELSSNKENESIDVGLTAERYPVDIKYTIDGSQPTAVSATYSESITVKDSAVIAAQLFQDGVAVGDIIEKRVDYHKAIGKEVEYIIPYSAYYSAGGDNALIDGVQGGLSHDDGTWQGFLNPFIEVIIDLGEVMPLKQVSTRFLQSAGAEIWFPGQVSLSISTDKYYFEVLDYSNNETNPKAEGTLFESFSWAGEAEGRYLKLRASRKPGIGGWIFLDEIIIW